MAHTADLDLAGRDETRKLRPARAIPPSLIDTALAFLLSRLAFYGAALVALAALPEYHGGAYRPWHTPAAALIDASWRWDSGWYRTLMLHGYQPGAGGGQSDLPFFPLYPLLVRLALLPFSLKWMFLAGVLLNHLAFFLALLAIWHYAAARGGRPLARRSLYLLAIFPGSLFFSAAYSESVFLLAAAATFLALQRGRFGLAGAAGLLAGLARPTGILLGLPFVLELWRQRGPERAQWAWRLGALLLVPAGLAGLMAYFWWRFGQPLIFLTAQNSWDHTRAWPWQSLDIALRQIEQGGHTVFYLMDVVNTAAALLALALGLALLRRDLAAGAFVLASLLVPLAFPTIGNPSMNLARYAAVLFPIFIELARWARSRPSLAALTLLFLPANLLLTALFVRWYWVV